MATLRETLIEDQGKDLRMILKNGSFTPPKNKKEELIIMLAHKHMNSFWSKE